VRLEIQQVSISSLDSEPIFTEQWCAFVFVGRREVYQSTGYHYATEARKAGLRWIESHNSAAPSSRLQPTNGT